MPSTLLRAGALDHPKCSSARPRGRWHDMRIGDATTFNVPPAGTPVDPAARQARVNAQADTLTLLMGTKHNVQVAANVSDGQGVDVYV
jgi:hypothetical protein